MNKLFTIQPTFLRGIRFQSSALRSTLISSTSSSSSSSSFSTSSFNLAQEADRGSFEAPYSEASVPLFDRLQAHPGALSAIEALAQLAKEKTGVDLASGQKPTMKMMLSLSNDKELRAAAEKLMYELTKAGIKVDPTQALAALKTMGGAGFEGVGLGEDGLPVRKGDGEGNGEKA